MRTYLTHIVSYVAAGLAILAFAIAMARDIVIPSWLLLAVLGPFLAISLRNLVLKSRVLDSITFLLTAVSAIFGTVMLAYVL